MIQKYDTGFYKDLSYHQSLFQMMEDQSLKSKVKTLKKLWTFSTLFNRVIIFMFR